MMYWGNCTGGWGMVVMTVSTLLVWGLVIAGVVMLVRYAGRRAWAVAPASAGPTPQQLLAERFVRDEIDEEEYTRRLKVLAGASSTHRPTG